MNTSHWGRVLGPVGLVLLLAAALTIVVSGETGLGFFNVFLGAGCIAYYLITNFRQLNQFASSRGTFFVVTSTLTALLVGGALVAAHYLAVKHPKSEDGERVKDTFEDLFKRYHALSEKFTYEFVDPVKDPMAVKQYNIHESGPRVIVKSGNIDEKVTNPTEEELTNAIVKATHGTEKKIYFLSGHGESDLDDRTGIGFSSLKAHMESEGLKSERLVLAQSPEIPADASALVVAGPQTALAEAEVALIKKYLDAGGKALLLLEPMVDSGLTALLKDYGVAVDPGMIVDPSAQKLFGTSPFIPIVIEYGQHPIVEPLRAQTMFPTSASLTISTAPDVTNLPLLRTLPSSWAESTPDKEPIEQDKGEKVGPLTLGVAITKNTSKYEAGVKRSDEARLVVIGDRDFLTNGTLSMGGNEDLGLNALNWLSDQTERITIRPRSRDASRVYLTGLQMAGIRFAATELPVALLAFGLAIFFNRRAK